MLNCGATGPGLRDLTSGDRLWVVEVIARFGGVVPKARGARHAMVAHLRAKVFPTEPIKMVAMVEGRKEVRAI